MQGAGESDIGRAFSIVGGTSYTAAIVAIATSDKAASINRCSASPPACSTPPFWRKGDFLRSGRASIAATSRTSSEPPSRRWPAACRDGRAICQEGLIMATDRIATAGPMLYALSVNRRGCAFP